MKLSALFLLAVLAGHPTGTPDLLVVVNKSDDTVSILNAADGAPVATVRVGVGPHEAEILADGKVAAVADYGRPGSPGRTVTLVDLARGEAVGAIDLGEGTKPHGLEALADGRLLVTAEGTRELLVVDPKRRRVVARIPTGRQISHMVSASPDGKRAFVASIGSGTLTAINLETGKVSKDLPTGRGAEGIDVTPDGREVWVSNRQADTVSVVDASTLALRANLPAAKFPIRVKITPDGKRALVSCAESGDVAVFDVAARKEIGRIRLDLATVEDLEGRALSTQFQNSPAPVGLLIGNGRTAWVASTNADVISVIDLEKLVVLRRLKAGREPDGLAGRFGGRGR